MENQIKRQLLDEITGHLLSDVRPSDYMNSFSQKVEFDQYPFRMLKLLKYTEQSPKYHPEGNVWNHTMLVLDEAAKVRNECMDRKVFMWAALLHDIGKPAATRIRKDRITSYDHDKIGERLSVELLQALTDGDDEFIHKVSSLVRYHMHILYVLKDLPYKDMEGLFRLTDIRDIALLCRCDRLGRTGADTALEESEYQEFLSRIRQLAEVRS